MCYLTDEPIDASEWHRDAEDTRAGASVEFLGMVRGEEGGQAVMFLDYQAHEPMAERVMARLVERVKQRWPLQRIRLRHRIGRVKAGELVVAISVHAPHRDEAFEACRFLIDAIKQDVPIWKVGIGANDTVREESYTHGESTH